MKNKASLFGLYLPFFIVFTLGAVAFRSAALFLNFDIQSGFFDRKLLISIANTLSIAGALILFTFIINGKKDVRLIPEFSSPTTVFVSVLTAGALMFLGIFLLTEFFKSQFSELKANEKIGAVLVLLSAVFAFVCAAYLVISLIIESRASRLRANLAMLSLLFFASYVAYLYFSTTLPLNAPNKLVDEMAYLFAAAFFLYETRLTLGRALWRGYIAFGFVAALLCAYSSIPSIIYYMVEKKQICNSIYESVLTLCLFLFISARTLLTGELIIDKVSPKLDIIITAANEREKAVKEREEKESELQSSEELENQIAISEISDIDETEEDRNRAREEEERKRELIDRIENLSTQEDG